MGRHDLVQACRFNRSYASKPAVAAKIGKEEVAGLYMAVKELVHQDDRELAEAYRRRMSHIEAELGGIRGIQLERVEHGSWADQFGVNVIVDPIQTGMQDGELYAACAGNDPPVEVGPRKYGVFVCVSTLSSDEEASLVARCIRAALSRRCGL